MMLTREEISRTLAERSIHLTAQRLAIAEFVLNRTDHPNADEVYRAVSTVLPVVSKATVYNTLNLLAKERLLQALTLKEGAARYDPNIVAHAHFLDTRTHRVVDVPPDQVSAVEHRLDPARFEIEEVQIVFHGRIRDEGPDPG